MFIFKRKKVAKLVKPFLDVFEGVAHLYKLSRKFEGYEYVIVSATGKYVTETLVLGVKVTGFNEIEIDWSDLCRLDGVEDPELVLKSIGYKVKGKAGLFLY